MYARSTSCPAARGHGSPVRSAGALSASRGIPASSSARQPVRRARPALARRILPSRSTSAIPVGASSKAERKRDSVSAVRSRARSDSRQLLRFTSAMAPTKAPWISAHSHGLARAASWLKTAPSPRAPATPWWRITSAKASPYASHSS